MVSFFHFYRAICWLVLTSALVACGSRGGLFEPADSPPSHPVRWQEVKDAEPKPEPRSPYGNPESYEQNGRVYQVLASADNFKERGVASWYGTKFHGRRTSSGETYDMLKMTAAHKTLPIPAYAKVTNLENGKQVVVKINDRGPFAKGRIIDLSYAAAHRLGMAQKGTAEVEIETISFAASHAPIQTAASTGVTGSSTQSTIGSQDRYVQVGAYSVYETAQKLAKVLDREIRLPVKIVPVRVNQSQLYRVRIGPVPTQQLAEDLVKSLNIEELGTPSIVYD